LSGAIKGIAALVVTTVFSLLLCEALVRAFVIVRNVGPSFTVFDPEYGKRLKPGFSTRRIAPEFDMRLTTNTLGFRGPEPTGPLEGVVLFLGDSFTMGYGVNDGEEFPALVRARLEAAPSGPIPVINAGIGDTGNGRWLKFLRGEARGYSPRLVVLQVHANDFQDNPAEGLFALGPDGGLVALPPRVPGTLRRIQGFVESVPGLSFSYLIGLAKQLSWPRGSAPPPDGAAAPDPSQPSDADRLTLALVDASVQECVANGWPVLLLLADVSEPKASWLRDAALARGAAVLEIPEKAKRPDLYFSLDGHWTTVGQAYTAERLLDRFPALGVPVPGAAARIP
jgi:lysophospholipase L1-like esterase